MTFKSKLSTEITIIKSLNLLPSLFPVVTTSTPLYVCRDYYPYLDRWSSRRDLHGGIQGSDLSNFLRPASRGLCCIQQCKFLSMRLRDPVSQLHQTAGTSFRNLKEINTQHTEYAVRYVSFCACRQHIWWERREENCEVGRKSQVKKHKRRNKIGFNNVIVTTSNGVLNLDLRSIYKL